MSKPYKHGAYWMIETADLLKMDSSITGEEEVHIVIKSSHGCDQNGVINTENLTYLYEEHTCPWNFLRFNIRVNGDCDPHGVFQWVESVVLPDDFDSMEDWEQFQLFNTTKQENR